MIRPDTVTLMREAQIVTESASICLETRLMTAGQALAPADCAPLVSVLQQAIGALSLALEAIEAESASATVGQNSCAHKSL